MVRSGVLAMAALACAVGLAAAGCGSTSAAGPRPVPADPRLLAAADTIQTHAAKGSTTFAGLVLDPWNHTITVYRLPDSALDARIRAEAKGVKVAFRDAAYSLVQMTGLVHRITADRRYWRTQGIQINGAAPQPNGSGVTVFVTARAGAAQQQLSRHYPDMRMTVQQQTAVIPTLHGPFPTVTATTPLPTKSSRD